MFCFVDRFIEWIDNCLFVVIIFFLEMSCWWVVLLNEVAAIFICNIILSLSLNK